MAIITKKCHMSNLLVSNTAKRLGIKNVPTRVQTENMSILIEQIINPLIKRFGGIQINSGFRSKKLNKAVGGARNSSHMTGQAVDLTVPGISPSEVCDWIFNNLAYDQLINEFDRWVHISFKNNQDNRNQDLKAIKYKYKGKKVKTKYVGIVFNLRGNNHEELEKKPENVTEILVQEHAESIKVEDSVTTLNEGIYKFISLIRKIFGLRK